MRKKDIKATLADGKTIEFEPDTDFLTVIKRLIEDVQPGDDLSGVTLEYKVKKGSDIDMFTDKVYDKEPVYNEP